MPSILELKEQRNQLSEETNRIVAAGITNTETDAKVDTMHADWVALGKQIERLERAAAMDAEMRAVKQLPSSPIVAGSEDESAVNPLAARLASKEYKSAYSKYSRRGMSALNVEERAQLNTGLAEARTQSGATPASGGYLVPVDLADSIEVALKYFGGMRQVATILRTASGAVLNYPTNNDTTNVGAILSGTAAEQDLTFGNVPFGAYTYTTKQIPVQNELLEDSAFDLDAFIRSAFVNRVGRIQNTHFTVGTGTAQPTGVVTAATAGITAAVGGATSLTYNNFVDITHSVDVAYRPGAKFMFNDLTLAAARKIVDTLGRPLLGMGLNGGDPDAILGYKFVINNDVAPIAASAKSILFGDFSKFMIRDVANSLSIMRLSELGALSNTTIFVGFVRADSNLIDAGTGPVKYFTQSAT